MAAKKRKAAAAATEEIEEVADSKAAEAPRRSTRASAARAASAGAESTQSESESTQHQQKTKDKKISEPPKPKQKKAASVPAPAPTPETEKAQSLSSPTAGPTVVIEACKQCNSFKTRALRVKEGLEKGVPGIVVTINPEKPRRGCFEIRTGDGNTFISLLGMPRPFKKMKDLDMDQVIEDVIKELK